MKRLILDTVHFGCEHEGVFLLHSTSDGFGDEVQDCGMAFLKDPVARNTGIV